MRKMLLMCSLIIVSNSAIADWVKAGGNEEFTVYYDSTTIRKNGNKVKMWVMVDFKKAQYDPRGEPYLTELQQMEYDCKEGQSRMLAFSQYSGNMQEGNAIHFNSDPWKWQPILPQSNAESDWKFACGIK